jgi:hypothetical protein
VGAARVVVLLLLLVAVAARVAAERPVHVPVPARAGLRLRHPDHPALPQALLVTLLAALTLRRLCRGFVPRAHRCRWRWLRRRRAWAWVAPARICKT